jgi:phage N-6-adenine-methyltransferase
MNTDLMFSSKSHMWETPQDFFNKFNDIYKFGLDVCASPENAKCEKYFTEEQDGLSKNWVDESDGLPCWMNPPYGRGITGVWIKKAYESSLLGATVVCLIPSRTDTQYWHEYVMKGEITFIKGRLKFGGHKDCAPFPSAVVVFQCLK